MSYQIFEDLCKRKGVRPADVSRATGVSTSTFTSWKKGAYSPKPDKLQKIADYFGVTLEYMVNGENADGYYYDKETAEIAQEIYQNKELHMLFDTARNAKAEDLKTFHEMLLMLKRKENHED